MSRLLAYLAVFAAAATPWLEVLFVVPAGVLGGLGPTPTVVIAAAGNIATLIPVVLLGERLRAWLDRRRQRRRPLAARDVDASMPASTSTPWGPGPTAWGSSEAEASVAPSSGAPACDAPSSGAPSSGAPPTGRRASGRARRVLERYGVPGLALLGPLVTGAHAAALVATGSGASPRRTLLWMSAGVVAWSIATGVLTVLGADMVLGRGAPVEVPGL